MKKVLSTLLVAIMTLSIFTGCGKSLEEMNDVASKMFKATNSVLAEMQDEDMEVGGSNGLTIDSDGKLSGDTGNFEKDEFIGRVSKYFEDHNKYYWIVYIRSGSAIEVYAAEKKDSKIIGAYPDSIDTADKTIDDIQEELKSKDTFGITVDDFVEQFNEKTKSFYGKLSADFTLNKSDDNKYTFGDDLFILSITEKNGYIAMLNVKAPAQVYDSFMSNSGEDNLVWIMLAPALVVDPDRDLFDLSDTLVSDTFSDDKIYYIYQEPFSYLTEPTLLIGSKK